MQNQVLKNSRGAYLGVIKQRGNVLEIFGRTGQFLGKYDPRVNQTYNKTGEKIGYGNLLTMLLCSKM